MTKLKIFIIGLEFVVLCGILLTGCNSMKPSVTYSTDTTVSSVATSDEEIKSEISETESTEDEVVQSAETISENVTVNEKTEYNAEITVKDYGTIKLALDAETAPITVENFVKLANSGFYDGLTFHRIIDGFMIQGGDPNGNVTGGSEQTIKGEFSSNGVENNISHTKGVISMARSQDKDSTSSQFFIMVDDSPFLDGDYATFGHVTESQEIVDKIAKDATPIDDNWTIEKEQQPVIEGIKIVE